MPRQGDTYDEALANLKNAINLNIAARRDLGELIPIETAIEKAFTQIRGASYGL